MIVWQLSLVLLIFVELGQTAVQPAARRFCMPSSEPGSMYTNVSQPTTVNLLRFSEKENGLPVRLKAPASRLEPFPLFGQPWNQIGLFASSVLFSVEMRRTSTLGRCLRKGLRLW
ncbi:hypothetical protein TorRG33x02_145000 [Trema orientale]|uniref:Secreted protein n=2 Tax=Cannabaceae TaxID=3481 RepID=A0A2P5C5Y5_PARAD|nr:hypothetical protein PanWU01x14_181180 [Parasponia andersonii]PON89666.1 hypothetical protein TorRG33x02_145000 [Trema orientale]